MQQPVGDLNPCLRLEKPASSTARRTSRIRYFSVGAYAERSHSFEVGREVLESSSPGFQPGAKPSQLPTRIVVPSLPHRHREFSSWPLFRRTKKARRLGDTGLG